MQGRALVGAYTRLRPPQRCNVAHRERSAFALQRCNAATAAASRSRPHPRRPVGIEEVFGVHICDEHRRAVEEHKLLKTKPASHVAAAPGLQGALVLSGALVVRYGYWESTAVRGLSRVAVIGTVRGTARGTVMSIAGGTVMGTEGVLCSACEPVPWQYPLPSSSRTGLYSAVSAQAVAAAGSGLRDLASGIAD